MFCRKCGTPIQDNAKFCPKCGEKVITEAPIKTPEETPSSQTTSSPDATASHTATAHTSTTTPCNADC